MFYCYTIWKVDSRIIEKIKLIQYPFLRNENQNSLQLKGWIQQWMSIKCLRFVILCIYAWTGDWTHYRFCNRLWPPRGWWYGDIGLFLGWYGDIRRKIKAIWWYRTSWWYMIFAEKWGDMVISSENKWWYHDIAMIMVMIWWYSW